MVQQLTKGYNNTENNVKVSKLSSSLYAVANDVASSLGEVPVAPVLGSPPWAGGIVPVLGNNLRHPSSDFCGTTLPRFESNPAVCVYNRLMYLFHLRHHRHTLSWSPPPPPALKLQCNWQQTIIQTLHNVHVLLFLFLEAYVD